MKRASGRFWRCYHKLPTGVRKRTDETFAFLRENPRHPSLRFKKTGTFWFVRIDIVHRALAVADGEDFIWVWIGSHDEYNRLIRKH